MAYTRLVLYLAFTSNEIGKRFLDDSFFYFIWTSPLKFTW